MLSLGILFFRMESPKMLVLFEVANLHWQFQIDERAESAKHETEPSRDEQKWVFLELFFLD